MANPLLSLDEVILVENGKKNTGTLTVFPDHYEYRGKITRNGVFDICDLRLFKSMVSVPAILGSRQRNGIKFSMGGGKSEIQFVPKEEDVPRLIKTMETAAQKEHEQREYQRKERKYNSALEILKSANSVQEFNKAISAFAELEDFQDAKTKVTEASEKKERYMAGQYEIAKRTIDFARLEADADRAYSLFKSIEEYRDSKNLLDECLRKKEDFAEKEKQYVEASHIFESATRISQVEKAQKMFEALGDYRDSQEKAKTCPLKINEFKDELYSKACDILDNAKESDDAAEAAKIFQGLKDYKDAKDKASASLAKKEEFDQKEVVYSESINILSESRSVEKLQGVQKDLQGLEGYKDSEQKAKECEEKWTQILKSAYRKACDQLSAAETPEEAASARSMFEKLGDFADSKKKVEECIKREEFLKVRDDKYTDAVKRSETADSLDDLDALIDAFVQLDNYKESQKYMGICASRKNQILEDMYRQASLALSRGNSIDDLTKANAAFLKLGAYKDSKSKAVRCSKKIEEIRKWSNTTVEKIAKEQKERPEATDEVANALLQVGRSARAILENPYYILGIPASSTKEDVNATADKIKKLQRLNAVASYKTDFSLRHIKQPIRDLNAIQGAVTQSKDLSYRWLWFNSPNSCVCWLSKEFHEILLKPVVDADHYDVFLACYMYALVFDSQFSRIDLWNPVLDFIESVIEKTNNTAMQAVLDHVGSTISDDNIFEQFQSGIIKPFDDIATDGTMGQIIGLYSLLSKRKNNYFTDYSNKLFSNIVAWLETNEKVVIDNTPDKSEKDILSSDEAEKLENAIADFIKSVQPHIHRLLEGVENNKTRQDIVYDKFSSKLWTAILILSGTKRSSALEFTRTVYSGFDSEHKRYTRNYFGFDAIPGAENDISDVDWDNLGDMYMNGDHGHEISQEKGANCYAKGADAGNASSMNSLGLAYLEGKGVPKDAAKACKLFEKAGDAGNPYGYYNLGLRYLNGEGVVASDDKAEMYLEKAAKAGVGSANEPLKALKKKKRRGSFTSSILSIQHNLTHRDIMADNYNQQIQNGAYRCFDMLELIAMELDYNGNASKVISDIHNDLRHNDIMADNIYQQTHAGANACYHMITIILMLLDDTGVAKDAVKDLDNNLRHNDIMANTVYQQIVNCMYRSVECLGLIATLLDNGSHKSEIASVQAQFNHQEIMANDTNQQQANAGYRMFDYLEIIAEEMDEKCSYLSQILSSRNDLSHHDIMADNVYGQIVNGWYRCFDMLAIIAMIND